MIYVLKIQTQKDEGGGISLRPLTAVGMEGCGERGRGGLPGRAGTIIYKNKQILMLLKCVIQPQNPLNKISLLIYFCTILYKNNLNRDFCNYVAK